MKPAQRRRSSRLAGHRHRCSLQSLDLECSLQSLVLDDQPHHPRESSKTTTSKEQQQQQQQQQQQPRRSKRIKEQNAKKQSLLPSSPVSTLDTPTPTSTSSHQNPSLYIVTPMKTQVKVRFGTNSVAKFSGCDPAAVIQRLSSDASQQLFPHECEGEGDDDDDEPSVDAYDDETKQNCHILAQWDDSFDVMDQIEPDDDDDASIEADNSQDEGGYDEQETQWRDATLIVEEEEDILFDTNMLTSPHVSHRRSNALSRPTKRVDEYFCKSCGRGMRCTTRFVYGEDDD